MEPPHATPASWLEHTFANWFAGLAVLAVPVVGVSWSKDMLTGTQVLAVYSGCATIWTAWFLQKRQRELRQIAAEREEPAPFLEAQLARVNEEALWQEKKHQTERSVRQEEKRAANEARAQPAWLNEAIHCPNPNCVDPQRTRMRGDHYFIPDASLDQDLSLTALPTDDPGDKKYVCAACYRRLVGFNVQIDDRATKVRDYAVRQKTTNA